MKRRRFWIYLSASLALHIFVLATLLVSRMKTPLTQPKETVKFELRETTEPNLKVSAEKTASKNGRGKKGGSVHAGAGGGLGRFSSKGDFYSGLSKSSNLKDEGNLGLAEEDWGSHGNQLGEVANFNQYEKIYQHVQGLLYYPGPLAYHGVGGAIQARLTFDGSSRCDWKKLRLGNGNPYLRFYVMALLKKLCGLEDLAHWHFRENQFVDMSFAFEIHENSALPTRPDTIQGNVFLFTRSHVKSITEYNLGPIHFVGLLPNLDVAWVAEHWDKWVNGRDPYNDLRERAD